MTAIPLLRRFCNAGHAVRPGHPQAHTRRAATRRSVLARGLLLLALGPASAAAADTTPDAFDFPDVSNIGLGTTQASAERTITGIDASTPVSVTGEGSPYIKVARINRGTSYTINSGQLLSLVMTAPSTYGTTRTATVTVGTVSDTWSVRTLDDTTPNPFNLTDLTGVAGNTLFTSETVTVTGITGNVPVTVSGDGPQEVSINGGPWVTTGTIQNGQTLTVRMSSAPTSLTAWMTFVSVGTWDDEWTVTTKDDACLGSPAVGTVCADGTVYAGLTPDGNLPFYTTTTDQGANAYWGTFSFITGAQSTTDGDGNTADIAAHVLRGDGDYNPNDGKTPNAAQLCAELSAHGHSDWYLPAIDELFQLYYYRASLPNFASKFYWSSTEVDSGNSKGVLFSSGIQSQTKSTYSDTRVRCVRNGADVTPDGFTLTDQTEIVPGTRVYTTPLTVTGLTGTTNVSISGQGNPTIKLNGTGLWVGNGTLSNGDTVEASLYASASPDTPLTATLAIGGVSDDWTVRTQQDIVPDAFTFTDQTGVALNTLRTATAVTITGLGNPAPVSVSGDGNPQISINGGAWATSGTITNNQTLAVRLTSAATYSTTSTATVTVGGVTDAWTVATLDDTTPDAFSFTDQLEVAKATLITSAPVTITGLSAPTYVTVSGTGSPQMRVNGGTWTSGSQQIANGQTLELRLTSANTFATAYTATASVNTVSDQWVVRTLDDNLPDAFSFTNKTNVALATLTTSNSQTITGLGTAPVPVSVTGDGTPQISINGGAWVTSGTISNNQTLALRLTSAAAYETTYAANLTLGGTSATWTVKTLYDYTPEAFSFTAQTDVALSTVITSNPVTITGLSSTATVSLSGNSSAQLSIDGGAWYYSAQTIANGQTLRVRLTSAASYNSPQTVTVNVGTGSAVFSVTTKGDNDPAAFSFTDQTETALETLITSNTLYITGITVPAPVTVSGDGSPQISINGGAWATSGTISNGQTLAVRLTSANARGTLYAANVLVSDVLDTWTVTTRSTGTPDAYSFTDQTGVARNTLITSAPVTITGISTCATVSAGGAEFSINGGTWYAQSRCIFNGETLRVRVTSSANFSTSTNTMISVGGIGDTWTVRTQDDNEPDAYSFTDQTGVNQNTLQTSNTLTITGLAAAAPVTVTGDGNPQISINGGAWATSGTLTNNQTLAVRLTSSANLATTATATVTVGSVSDQWTVRTLDDTQPDEFSFTDQTGVPLSTLITSDTVTITGITTGVPVTVYGDGSPQISINGGAWATSGTITDGQSLAVRLTSPGTYSTYREATVTVGDANFNWTAAWTVQTQHDTVPNAFTFTDQTNVPLSTLRTATAVTITGLGPAMLGASPVTVTGEGSPQISIAGGAWATSGTIMNNQTLAVRLTSAATFSTKRSATVTVGGVSDTWNVTTLAGDTTPDAFSFTDQSDVALSTLTTANTLTISGINDGAAVTVSGDGNPQISINGGAWASSGTLTNNQTLAVRLTSSASYGATSTATVAVGGVTDTWTVTTLGDSTPDAFTFTDQTGAYRNVLRYSDTVTISGITTAVPVTVSGEGSPKISINGGTYGTSGTLTNGQTLRVRLTSSPDYSTTYAATVTVGAASDTWTVRTLDDDWPDAFAFSDQSGVARNTLITSAPVTITGITGDIAVTVSGAGSPQISINGGAWVTSGTIQNGQTLAVRLTSADAYGTPRGALVSVGTVDEYWYVVTGPNPVGDACQGTPTPGTVCADGTIYAGVSPDGNLPLYVTPFDHARGPWGPITALFPINVVSNTDGDDNTLRAYQVLVLGLGDDTPINSAVELCAALSAQGHDDWYLPAADELAVLAANSTAIGTFDPTQYYWASTEQHAYSGKLVAIATGSYGGSSKNVNGGPSRCVRTGVDLTPDAFTLTDQSEVALSTLVTASPVTIAGLAAPTPVTIAGDGTPQLSINGGAWAATGTIANGQTLAVRLTSAATLDTTRTATVMVGKVSDTWTVRTHNGTRPDPFTFTDQSDVPLSTVRTATAVTITGLSNPAPVTVTGDGSPQISINGGAWSTSGTITNNQTLAVRLTSAATFSTTRSTTVTVGGVSDTWDVTTLAADFIPDPFSFTDQSGIALSTLTTANTLTISGINDGAAVTVSGDGNPQVSINGGAWATSGTITNNQTLAVRLTSAASYDTTSTATVAVGGVTDTWTVTTLGDTVPDPFNFTDQLTVVPNTLIAAPAVTITGITVATPVTVTGDGSPQISLNGGAWATSGTIVNNQTLAVRLTSAADSSTTRTATVTVGGVSDAWFVRTADDTTPDPFSFTDQVDVEPSTLTTANTLTLTGINAATPVTVSGDGSPQVSLDGGPWVTSGTIQNGQTLAVRLTSAPDYSTTYTATVTVGGVSDAWTVRTLDDSVPDAFSFTDQVDVALSSAITSNTLILTGFNAAAPVTVSGDGDPEISLNGGPWVTSGTLSPGQTLAVRLTSAADFSATRSATVTVGGVSDTWAVTTLAQDTTPDAFSFTDQSDVARSTLTTANTLTLTGINDATAVSVSGDGDPQVSLDGGPWVTSGTLTPGQTLAVRLTSAADYSTLYTATVTVGGVSDAWTVRTLDDTVPDAFSFTDQSGVARATAVTSNTLTISGLTGAAPVTVSGSGTPQVSLNGGDWVTSGAISNGQTLSVRLTSAPTYSTARSAQVTVGGVSDTWTVTTLVDSEPDAFTFTDQSDVPRDTRRTSDTLSITGLNVPVTVTVSGDGGPQFSINGGPWVTSGTLTSGQTLAVQLTSAADFSTPHSATVTVGASSATWTVTTLAQDTTPDAFSFTDQSDVPRSTLTTANTLTLTGFNDATAVSVSGDGDPQVSLAGGPWVTSGTLTPGQTLTVRLTSAADYSTLSTATVTVGGVSDAWTVRTVDDTVPDAFSFTDQSNVVRSTLTTANTLTLTGLGVAAPVTVSGDGNPQVSLNGGPWVTSGALENGQTLAVRLTSAADFSTPHRATITVGAGSTTWTVTTLARDTTPDAFNFTDLTDVARSTLTTSNTLTLTGINDGAAVAVSGDGNPQVSLAGGPWVTSGTLLPGQTLAVRLTSAADYSTLSTATVTVGGVSDAWTVRTVDDTVPDAFSFVAQVDVALSSAITSNTVTLTGLGAAAPVTVSGDGNPQVSIQGGAWVTSGSLAPGQTLAVRLTSAADFSTPHTATVTVGGVSASWAVTTQARDTTPDPFSFADQSGVPLSTLRTALALPITGINDATAVTVTGDGDPRISINGGAWATSGAILNNQTLQVRLTSAGAASTAATATVTVGGVSDAWTVRTVDDTTPDPFSFTDQSDVEQQATITSNTLTLTGLTGAAAVAVSGAGHPQVSIQGGPWVTAGTLTNGQTLAVRLTSSAQAYATARATVTVGGVSDEWSVRTRDTAAPLITGAVLAADPPRVDLTIREVPVDGPGQVVRAWAEATRAATAQQWTWEAGQLSSPGGDADWAAQLVLPALDSGRYALALYAADAAGNVSAPHALEYVYDVAPPVITQASLGAGNQWVDVQISEAPEDGARTVDQVWVELVEAGGERHTLQAEGLTAPVGAAPWQARVALSTVPTGRYTLSVGARDAAGNLAAPLALGEHLLYNQPPVIATAQLGDHAKWLDVTTQAAPSGVQDIVAFWVEAQPVAGGAPLTVAGEAPAAISVDGQRHWQGRVGLATLISGRYTLQAFARDARDGVSAPFTLSEVLLDNTPPVITGTQLGPLNQWVEASLFEGPADGPHTVTRFWVAATPQPSGAPILLPHDQLVAPGGDGNWLARSPLTALAEGYYALTAHAEDAAGNQSAPYAFSTRLAIDHQAPGVTFATVDGQPLAAAPLQDPQAITFRLTDNLDPQPAVVSVTLRGGALTTPLTLDYQPAGDGYVVRYPATLPLLADDTYEISVVARDANQNEGTHSAPFAVGARLLPLLAAHGEQILLPLVAGEVDVRRETQDWPLTTEAAVTGHQPPQPLRGTADLIITLSADARDALVIAGQPLNPGQSLYYPDYNFDAARGRITLPMHPLASAALPEGRFGDLQVRIDRPLAPVVKAPIHLWSPAAELLVKQSAPAFAKKVHPAELSLVARGATLCAGDFQALTDPGTTRHTLAPDGTALCAVHWVELPPDLQPHPLYKRALKGFLNTTAESVSLRYQPGLYVVRDNSYAFYPALTPAPTEALAAAGAPTAAVQEHSLALFEPEPPALRFNPASAAAEQGDWLPAGSWATRTGPYAPGTVTAMSKPYLGLVLSLRDADSGAVLSERATTTDNVRETVTTDLAALEDTTRLVARVHYSLYPEVFTEVPLTFVALPNRLTLKLRAPGPLANDTDSLLDGTFGEWGQGAFSFAAQRHGAWTLQLYREVPGPGGRVREPLGAPTSAIAADGSFTLNAGPLTAGSHRLLVTATFGGSSVVRDQLIESAVATVRVQDATAIACTLSATPAESPPGVTATLKVVPENRDRYADVGAIQWQRSADGVTWAPITLPDGYTASFGYTERLDQSGRYYYQAVTTNRYSGAEATCPATSVHIYDTPQVTLSGPNYTLLGAPADWTAAVAGPARPTEYAWVVRRGYADQAPLQLTGPTITLPADALGLWQIEVKARYLDAPEHQRAWGAARDTLRVDLPRLHRPILTGASYVEVGKPYTYTATVNPPWGGHRVADNLMIQGEWRLPDGTAVAGDTLTYTPTADPAQRLLYRAWIPGYEEASLATGYLDLRPWTYVFPTASLTTRVLREAQPKTVGFTLNLANGNTNGEPLTVTWTLPAAATSNPQSDTYVSVAAWEPGIYPVTVQVADSRGNLVQLAENLVVGDPPPLLLDTKVMIGDSWQRAPAPVTVRLYPQGKMPAEQFTAAEVRLNGDLVSDQLGSSYRLDIPSPGEHTIDFKLTTSYGRTVERRESVTLIEGVPPQCTLETAKSGEQLQVVARCTATMGKLASYKWWVTYADAPTTPVAWGTTSAYKIMLTKAHLERGVLGVTLVASNDKGQLSNVAELAQLSAPRPTPTPTP